MRRRVPEIEENEWELIQYLEFELEGRVKSKRGHALHPH